jgi:signal transduction histidine kinase
LKVIDDGKGFDPAAQSIASVGHWGLKGMGERASHIHGKLKVHSKPASGTLVELTVAAWWIYQGTRRLGL